MNDNFLYITQSITKLYSHLNTFNKNQKHYKEVASIELEDFVTYNCINEVTNVSNYVFGVRNTKYKQIDNQLLEDLILCLLYWIESLLKFITLDNENMIHVLNFVDKKTGRVGSLVVILECVSSIISLVGRLLSMAKDEGHVLKSDFENNLTRLLDLVKNTLKQSRLLENSKEKDEHLVFIKFYKNFVNIISKNWIGKLAAIAFVYLNSAGKNFDFMILNVLLKYAFTLEMNGAIQAQKNVRKHNFVYKQYLSKEKYHEDSEVYGSVLKLNVKGETVYQICNIKKNALTKFEPNDYLILFEKISEEHNYLAFQYHINVFPEIYEIKNNQIFQYYQHVKQLQDFDRIIYLSSLANPKGSTKSLLMLMNGTANSEKLNSASAQIEKTVKTLSKSFLKNTFDFYSDVIIAINTYIQQKEQEELVKELLSTLFFNIQKANIDFVTHSHGKLLASFIYEYCLFNLIKKLKTINESYLQFLDWDHVMHDLNVLIKSYDYSNAAFAIGILFNYWEYLPINKRDVFLLELVINNWAEVLSPEVRGFSLIDILLAKFIIYKQLFVHDSEILKLLLELELKNQYNKNVNVSLEFPNDALILPNFRKLLLFKYPCFSKEQEVKNYDITLQNISKSLDKQLPRISVKSMLAKKQLPNPNSNNQNLNEPKKDGSLFNSFINDFSKTITQFTQPLDAVNADVKNTSKDRFEGLADESQQRRLVAESLIESKQKRVYQNQQNKDLYFFKTTSLDTQLLENYMDDYNPLGLSQEFKDVFSSMKSMLLVSNKGSDDSMIRNLGYKSSELEAMKLSKHLLVDKHNQTWTANHPHFHNQDMPKNQSQHPHNTVITSMDDVFASGGGPDPLNLASLTKNDISSKIFKFIQDANDQLTESLEWNSNINNNELEEELRISSAVKMQVMPEILKKHLSHSAAKEHQSNHNVKKFVAVFNKTCQEYRSTQDILGTGADDKNSGMVEIVFFNEFLRFED